MRYKGKPPLVSFVVSVYNLERYIGSCLDSILSQPFYDYEIVLVNNNLSDGSDDICRRFRFAGKLYKFMGASNNLCRMQRREIFSADKASEGVVAVRRGRRQSLAKIGSRAWWRGCGQSKNQFIALGLSADDLFIVEF